MAVTEIRDHAARENKSIELPALGSLQVNGTAPFWSHPDGARERLDEAYAILMLLQGAHQVCAEVGDNAADAFATINHELSARALRGVASLIALSRHQEICAEAERKVTIA
jgi:hypothetical protein